MSYKIKKIYIKDFKIFKNEDVYFDFSDKNLLVLDGPNGYGKSTVFDALELIFSGKIHRLDQSSVTDKNVIQPVFYSDKLEIKVEICNESNNLVLGLKCNSVITSKRLTDWNCLELYKLNKFEDNISSGRKLRRKIDCSPTVLVGDDELSQILERNNFLTKFFDYYYYIQQEESTFYLKNNERKRSEEIESLFNTKNELEQFNEIVQFEKKLNEYFTIKKNEYNSISNKININNIKVENNIQNLEYISLLNNIKNPPFWDVKEFKEISKEIVDKAKEELDLILDLVQEVEDYKKHIEVSKFDKIIKRIIDDEILLKQLTFSYEVIKTFANIEKKYLLINHLRNFLNKLRSQKWVEELKDEDIRSIQKMIPEQFDQDQASALIFLKGRIFQLYNRVKRDQRSTADLEIAKKNFIALFDQIVNSHHHTIVNCPLCGHNWESMQRLKKAFIESQEKFKKDIESTTEDFLLLVKEWDKDTEELRNWIEHYINDEKNFIDDEKYKLLFKLHNNSEMLQKCNEWLSENKINIDIYKSDNLSKEFSKEDIDKLKSSLRMMQYIRPNPMFRFTTRHDEVFSIYFNATILNIQKINSDMIRSKIRYIEGKYNDQLIKTNSILKKLDSEIKNTNELLRKISNIKKIYTNETNKYHQQILKNIEIPLFIYSAKILHGYKSEGSMRTEGIRMGDITTNSNDHKNLRLRFIPNIEGNAYDVTYTLSSGQISGLVIAFTLALNKIYGNKDDGIGFLLIDDPVQTMDDINMAALVDLLRHEFRDKQLIISTHEESFSRYIRYKFHSLGLSYSNINLKEKSLMKN